MYIIHEITILKSSLQKYTIVIAKYFLSQMTMDRFRCTHFLLSSIIDKAFIGPDYMSITAGV